MSFTAVSCAPDKCSISLSIASGGYAIGHSMNDLQNAASSLGPPIYLFHSRRLMLDAPPVVIIYAPSASSSRLKNTPTRPNKATISRITTYLVTVDVLFTAVKRRRSSQMLVSEEEAYFGQLDDEIQGRIYRRIT